MQKKKRIPFMINFVEKTTDTAVSISQEEHVQEGNLSSAYIFRKGGLHLKPTKL